MIYKKITYTILLSLLMSIIHSSNTNAFSFNIKDSFIDISITKEDKLNKQVEAKKRKYKNIKKAIDKKTNEIDSNIEESETFKVELEELNSKVEELANKVEEKRNAAVVVPVAESMPNLVEITTISKVSPTESGNMYAPGNCTWYVKSRRNDIGSFWGNANQWLSSAISEGYKTGSVPQVGAIGVNFDGYFGHVVYVEGVDGNNVYVSEMNYNGLGVISSRTTSSSEFQYIYSL